MVVTFFDVSFKSYGELFSVLGYSALMARSFVLKRYGSYEGMIATRLRLPIEDTEGIKAKLLELKSAYERGESGESSKSVAESKSSHDLSQLIDLYTLSCLKASWKALTDAQRDLILDSVSITTGVDKTLLDQQVAKVVSGASS